MFCFHDVAFACVLFDCDRMCVLCVIVYAFAFVCCKHAFRITHAFILHVCFFLYVRVFDCLLVSVCLFRVRLRTSLLSIITM